MKFEFDHKTGTMQPKKDEEIYFAKSQGGGLIVDDKKHNIKFIIERDERITKLFGSFDKDKLNLYDMRDARMIADRVTRLFGSKHKYCDYHYFLKGYVMKESVIKSYTDFIEESTWGKMLDQGTGEIRKEEGRIIGKLEDGTRLILPNEAFADGDIVDFDDVNFYTFDESGEDLYVAVINDGDTDTYWRYDEDSEDTVNMIKCITITSEIREHNDFAILKALMRQGEWDNTDLEDLNVTTHDHHINFSYSTSYDFSIYTDRAYAIEDAVEFEEEVLDETRWTKETFDRFRNNIGDDFIDESSMEDDLKESWESYYDDMSEEEAIEELLNWKVIEDSEDYFELDEDGETDHTQPKFDYTDYTDEYSKKRLEDIGDVIDDYLTTYGYDNIESYINTHKLAERIVELDGPGRSLSGYDSEERTEDVDGETYYIYRRN